MIDDNARKFITDALSASLLEQNEARSYTLTVDWLETSEANEKKLAHKVFDDGSTQLLLITKVTKNNTRSTERTVLSPEDYEKLLPESILNLQKKRSEFSYLQNGIPYSCNYDAFSEGTFRMLEVDATTEHERAAFNPNDFPAHLDEVTGDLKYYGYRVAETIKATA